MDTTNLSPDWRQAHLGRLLGHAMRRFDARVLELMAADTQVPLALSNLAARDQVGAAHVHITRHLSLRGDRLTDLAQRAGMAKQSMGVHVIEQPGNATEQWLVDTIARQARRLNIGMPEVGVFDSPDAFYARHGSNLSGVKRWLYERVIRHRMNRNVARVRASKW